MYYEYRICTKCSRSKHANESTFLESARSTKPLQFSSDPVTHQIDAPALFRGCVSRRGMLGCQNGEVGERTVSAELGEQSSDSEVNSAGVRLGPARGFDRKLLCGVRAVADFTSWWRLRLKTCLSLSRAVVWVKSRETGLSLRTTAFLSVQWYWYNLAQHSLVHLQFYIFYSDDYNTNMILNSSTTKDAAKERSKALDSESNLTDS